MTENDFSQYELSPAQPDRSENFAQIIYLHDTPHVACFPFIYLSVKPFDVDEVLYGGKNGSERARARNVTHQRFVLIIFQINSIGFGTRGVFVFCFFLLLLLLLYYNT